MKHLFEALEAMPKETNPYIKLSDHEVAFTIQDGPIKEVGVNGIQAVDMLKYNLELFKSLNKAFPCNENESTIECIQIAIDYQIQRTVDRMQRGVEGESKA